MYGTRRFQGGHSIHQDAADRELVGRILRDRDEGAFRILYDRHTPRLLRFVMRLLAGCAPVEAEEVVQETWVRAITLLDGFGGRSELSTWLHGIGLNVVRELRRRGERMHRGEEIEASIMRDAVARDGDPEARIDLERGLACLPEGRRTVLVLHDLYGFTHDDVAGMLDISVGTSKSQLHDARRQLESLLRGRTTGER